MTRRWLLPLLILFVSAPGCFGQQIRIGVLSRYHPRQLELKAARTNAVVVRIGAASVVLEPGERAKIGVAGDALFLEARGTVLHAAEMDVAGRIAAADWILAVQGSPGRHYRGTLSIRVKDGELTAVVTMDLETAVTSAVAAESEPGTPLEALKALAVVARSYYAAAKERHQEYDFCDLTHCQVLRGVPLPTSPAARAAAATRGLVLSYGGKPFAAMFTRSCGGRTRTAAQAGLPVNGYPYFAVICAYCHGHPYVWTRTVSREDAGLLEAKGEAGRLAVDRRLGWNAVPSNNFTAHADGAGVQLEGKGQGHGMGLCQRGAAAMAAGGAGYRRILSHYFPNTEVVPSTPAPGR